MKIKQLPLAERPRERLDREGEEALSTAELLAVLLGCGTEGKSVLELSYELLSHFGSLTALVQAGVNDLCRHKGLGGAKAIKLKAILGLARRLVTETSPCEAPLTNPHQAYQWVKDRLAYKKQEVFGVILQDVRGHPLRWVEVSVGTLTQTLVHPREVFFPAIEHRAASILLVHNHPSHNANPSTHDIQLTQLLLQTSKIMGIPIHDHLIVTPTSFFSFRENGMIVIQESLYLVG